LRCLAPAAGRNSRCPRNSATPVASLLAVSCGGDGQADQASSCFAISAAATRSTVARPVKLEGAGTIHTRLDVNPVKVVDEKDRRLGAASRANERPQEAVEQTLLCLRTRRHYARSHQSFGSSLGRTSSLRREAHRHARHPFLRRRTTASTLRLSPMHSGARTDVMNCRR
jgi:hypothetical protein